MHRHVVAVDAHDDDDDIALSTLSQLAGNLFDVSFCIVSSSSIQWDHL